MSFGMFEAAVAGDKENEHQKNFAKTRLAQAAAEVDQKLGSFLSKATSKSDYIERVRLAENDFRAIVGKYLEGDTGFKAVATKMAGHYVRKNTRTSSRRVASSVYELAGELARQTGRSEQEMEEALILYLEQMESLDGVSYDEDNLPSEARDFLTEAVLHGISAGDFRSAKVRRPSRRRANRRTARGVDFSRATYDLFEDGSGDSWYDLVDEDHRSYDSDDLDEVVHWLKQDGLLPYDGRLDTYTSDSYEDPYTSQRYEDSAALRGFTDEELHEIKRRMSSRRRVARGDDYDWLEGAEPGTEAWSWDPRGGEETEDGDYTGEYIKFVKTKGGKWYNNDYRTDLSAEELAGNERPIKRSRRQRQAAGTNERFPGTNEMFERAGWQSTDPEKSEWLSPSGYAMYDGSTGSAYYLDDRGIVNSFYTLEDEEFRDDLPQVLSDDEEYQSRLWEY